MPLEDRPLCQPLASSGAPFCAGVCAKSRVLLSQDCGAGAERTTVLLALALGGWVPPEHLHDAGERVVRAVERAARARDLPDHGLDHEHHVAAEILELPPVPRDAERARLKWSTFKRNGLQKERVRHPGEHSRCGTLGEGSSAAQPFPLPANTHTPTIASPALRRDSCGSAKAEMRSAETPPPRSASAAMAGSRGQVSVIIQTFEYAAEPLAYFAPSCSI